MAQQRNLFCEFPIRPIFLGFGHRHLHVLCRDTKVQSVLLPLDVKATFSLPFIHFADVSGEI